MRLAEKPNATLRREATAILRADHKLVSELFDAFKAAPSRPEKRRLAERICQELTVHTQIEEEIFYPAVKAALRNKTLVPQARVEHDSLKVLVKDIMHIEADDELFDARVMVLAEYVRHHVKEEQNRIFPEVLSSDLDLGALGARLQQRKLELQRAADGLVAVPAATMLEESRHAALSACGGPGKS